MGTWPAARDAGRLERFLNDRRAVQYWGFTLQQNAATLENWDYAWLWSVWHRNGLAIHPNVNLVTNIGFGAGATHTDDAFHPCAAIPTEPMTFPLRHPAALERDADGDLIIESTAFGGTLDLLWQRLHARHRARRQVP
jgi:hypothetical protein